MGVIDEQEGTPSWCGRNGVQGGDPAYLVKETIVFGHVNDLVTINLYPDTRHFCLCLGALVPSQCSAWSDPLWNFVLAFQDRDWNCQPRLLYLYTDFFLMKRVLSTQHKSNLAFLVSSFVEQK